MNLWLLGSSESLLKYDISKLEGKATVALHKVFPYAYISFGIVPEYWTWADPWASMVGMKYLTELTEEEFDKFRGLKIVLPDFLCGTYATFREHCGTTPLGRIPAGWSTYKRLLKEIQERGIQVTKFKAVSTKYLYKNSSCDPTIMSKKWTSSAPTQRFISDNVIIGSCEFDSESVIGSRFKWGLENKLSSYMFPVANFLGAKNVFILGFDCIGSRFYEVNGATQQFLKFDNIESGARHPWNDESQDGNAEHIPLDMMRKWLTWEASHGMKFFNVVEDEYTILNKVFEYKPYELAAGED